MTRLVGLRIGQFHDAVESPLHLCLQLPSYFLLLRLCRLEAETDTMRFKERKMTAVSSARKWAYHSGFGISCDITPKDRDNFMANYLQYLFASYTIALYTPFPISMYTHTHTHTKTPLSHPQALLRVYRFCNKYLKPAKASTPDGRIWFAGRTKPKLPVSLSSDVKVNLAPETSLA